MATWSADLGDAIRERQLAANVASPHPAATPISDTDAINFINAIADEYVQGVWQGGLVLYTALTSSYATGVTAEAQMWGKVRAMIQTIVQSANFAVTKGDSWLGAGTSGVSEAIAQANCDTNWAETASGTNDRIAEMMRSYENPPASGNWTAEAAHDAVADITISNLDTSMNKTVEIWNKLVLDDYDNIHTHASGLDMSGFVDESYELIFTEAVGAGGSSSTGSMFGTVSTKPTGGYASDGRYDFPVAFRHILVTWAFSDTYPTEPLAGEWTAAQWAPGMNVASRQSTVDYIFTAGESQGEWVASRPTDFPGAPSDGDTHDDDEHAAVWTYNATDTEWRAQVKGANDAANEVVDSHHELVCMDAGVATKLVEFGPFDVGTSLIAQATVNCDEVTSVRVKNITHRWCVVVVGTPPTYDDTLYIGLSIFKTTA